jgi:hypothetical protein
MNCIPWEGGKVVECFSTCLGVYNYVWDLDRLLIGWQGLSDASLAILSSLPLFLCPLLYVVCYPCLTR